MPLPDKRHGRRALSVQTPPPHPSSERTPIPRLRPPSFRRRACTHSRRCDCRGGSRTTFPDPRRSGGGRNPEKAGKGDSRSSTPTTQSTKSPKSPNPKNQSSDNEDKDDTDWDEIYTIIDAAIEESDRSLTEQDIDSDIPPHVPDYSAFDLAADNSYKWFLEWKNSIDPEEYQAIVKEKAAAFNAKIDLRIERRKQIKVEREQREKEEAEREAQQANARAEAKAREEEEAAAAKEIEDLGPPPSRSEHKSWSPTPSIPTSFRLVNCGHPKCKLHDGPIYYPEDDKSSPYYWDGQQPSWFGSNRF